MNLEFGTTQLAPQPYLGIRATTTLGQLGAIMGPLFGEGLRLHPAVRAAANWNAVRDLPLDGG